MRMIAIVLCGRLVRLLILSVGVFGWVWFVFFFSSRRRHTRCGRDWSSDVCSSDLALAWKAWQNSRGAGGASPAEGEPVERLGGEARERRSLELLQAMIMAARADGHIDDQERTLITQQIDALGADQELHAWVERQLAAPLDAEALARQVDSPQAAREMYLISVAMVDEQNAMERAWLDQLGRALALPGEVVTELERQAREAG